MRRRPGQAVAPGGALDASGVARTFAFTAALALHVLCAALPTGVFAHEIRPAVATVTFAPPQYTIDISGNVEAMIAGVGPKVADTNESPNARRYDALRQDSPETLQQRIREFTPALVNGLAIEFD